MHRVKDIIVTSLADAPAYLRRKHDPVHCILSIGDPGEKKPHGFASVKSRLRLEFGDWRDEGDGRIPPPQRVHVERIAKFAKVAAGKRTLIHCHMGISRSTAAAYIMATTILGPGSELDALDHIVKVRPIALPNTRMVRIADEVLGRGGAMTRAIRERRLLMPGTVDDAIAA
jgi:predicted protein tyrosine phosphatase